MKPTLFVDMDGTMTRFYDDARCLELMSTAGFFENLKPYKNIVEAIKILINDDYHQLDVYGLSAVPNGPEEAREKKQWLRKHIPYLQGRTFFCQPGVSKADFVKREFNLTDGDFILLDDYSANLHKWRYDTGIAIKCVNDINDRGEHGPLWDGPRIRYDWDPHRIAHEILRIGGVEK